MRRVLIPLIFGIAGCAVLIGLGVWQVQRLAWKQGILARIEARIAAEPVPLPAAPRETADEYRPVTLTGKLDAGALRVLVSHKRLGAGHRVIAALDTGARRVLIDRGFVSADAAIPPPPETAVTVTGNLLWPDDRTGATPENDVTGNMWFARDVAQMAGVMDTAPLLIVARTVSPPEQGVTPLPVGMRGIPNDHLSYAITWFSLAAIWAAMTGYFLWRNRGWT